MVDIEDKDQLIRYLTKHGRITSGEAVNTRTLQGGVSNRTVWVQREDGEAWVLKQALEKLRVKVDWFCSPQRVHREALGMRRLATLAPPGSTVSLVFEDHEHHIIAMQAVPQPHENWKTMLLDGDIQQEHFTQFADLLATVHTRSHHHPDDLAAAFQDRSYMEQLRIEPFYLYPASILEAAQPFLESLIKETRGIRTGLVHGDFSPKNILIHQNRLILLDHEVIHFGDPAFDVGFAMAHFLSKAHALQSNRARFHSCALHFWKCYFSQVQTWCDAEWEARSVRHTIGCLLARAAGRSTLDYFSEEPKQRQQRVVLEMMPSPAKRMEEMMDQFLSGCEHV